MNPSEKIDVLNRLFRILNRSLPVYLQSAQPWAKPGDERTIELLAAIAADQQSLAQQVAEAVRNEGGSLDPGHFPLSFTAVHDLSVDFLLKRVVERHRFDVEAVQQCAAEFQSVGVLSSLAEEILRSTKRHLEDLESAEQSRG